jgi:hypothetical protein
MRNLNQSVRYFAPPKVFMQRIFVLLMMIVFAISVFSQTNVEAGAGEIASAPSMIFVLVKEQDLAYANHHRDDHERVVGIRNVSLAAEKAAQKISEAHVSHAHPRLAFLNARDFDGPTGLVTERGIERHMLLLSCLRQRTCVFGCRFASPE